MSRYTRETESLRAQQEVTEEKLKYEFLEQVHAHTRTRILHVDAFILLQYIYVCIISASFSN